MWLAIKLFFGGLWARAWPYILMVLSVLAVAFGLYKRGKDAGREAEQVKQVRKVEKAIQERQSVEKEIRRAEPSDNRKRLRDKWSR